MALSQRDLRDRPNAQSAAPICDAPLHPIDRISPALGDHPYAEWVALLEVWGLRHKQNRTGAERLDLGL